MNVNEVLRDLLDCEISDLDILKKCSYNYKTVMNNVIGLDWEKKDFWLVILGCIYQFQSNVQAKIDELDYDIECNIKELEQLGDENNGNLSEEKTNDLNKLWKQKEELEELSPFDDIEYDCNVPVVIWIEDDEIRNKYKKYLGDFIEEENKNIGFCSLYLN